MRLFIALDLPREAINEIKRIQEQIRKKVLFTGKYTEPENLHLTLKFLGEIDEEKIELVKEKLKEIKFNEFEASLGEIGIFNKSFPKIIWIKLNGRALFVLQKQINEVLEGLFEKEVRFMAHVTIARVKHVRDKKGLLDYMKCIKVKSLRFKIEKFLLKSSELKPEGSIYEDLEEYFCVE